MVGNNATLILQQVTISKDSSGAPTVTFGDKKRIKGRLDKMSTSEAVKHNQLGEDASHKFICRYFKEIGVTVADRFRMGSTIYNITGITNYDDHSYEFILRKK
jgi:SPP1 family predicted phage head-tail adaptor